jgi:hypothetical protein
MILQTPACLPRSNFALFHKFTEVYPRSIVSFIAHPSSPTRPSSQIHHPATHPCSHKSQSHCPVPLYLRRSPTRRDNGEGSGRTTACRGRGSVCIVLVIVSLAHVVRLGVIWNLGHTTLVLRLIPRTITTHVLRLLVLMLALVAEHLVEEAELRGRRDEPCREDEDEAGEARHDCSTTKTYGHLVL